MIDEKTLAELEHACEVAKDYAGAYNDAIKAQAEAHQLEPGGLKAYVTARVNDRLAKLKARADTLERLQMAFDLGAAE